jgi:hypothetical protein
LSCLLLGLVDGLHPLLSRLSPTIPPFSPTTKLFSKLSLLLVSGLAATATADLTKRSAAALPDVLNVKTTNVSATVESRSSLIRSCLSIVISQLYPEDGVYDIQRNLLYQSNLWKGQINVWNPHDNSHFNVKIAGVVSAHVVANWLSLSLMPHVSRSLHLEREHNRWQVSRSTLVHHQNISMQSPNQPMHFDSMPYTTKVLALSTPLAFL